MRPAARRCWVGTAHCKQADHSSALCSVMQCGVRCLQEQPAPMDMADNDLEISELAE